MLTALTPRDLIGQRFRLGDLLGGFGGRVSIYEPPEPDGQYSGGFDFALGLEDRDWDTGCIFKFGTQPARQVAEVQGHWGERFDRVIYALCMYYNGAFIVGENNNTGLSILRTLWDEYQYANMFGERDEKDRTRRRLKKLGYSRVSSGNDLAMLKLRRAVYERAVLLRSRPLIDQMSRYQFRPRSSVEHHEAVDSDMSMKLSGGGSPDLIVAAAMGYHGLGEMGLAPRVKPAPKPYTAAAMFPGDEDLLSDEPRADQRRVMRRGR